jgi:signal peptidase I
MLQHEVITSDGELSPLGSKKPSKRRRVLNVIGEVLLLLAFTLVLSISGQITYDYARYSTFFVNGMSMYPTLNKNVTFVEENGTSHDGGASDSLGANYLWGDFNGRFNGHSSLTLSGTFYCDYGMMDAKPGFITSLKRFDIIVTYFYSGDTDLKIKRLMALPGESWKFDKEGNFYVGKDPSSLALVEQPFLDEIEKEHPGWKASTYTGTSNMSGTLGEDEYFVCGDNRLKGASGDSRSATPGPIKRSLLQGKAITLTGICADHVANGLSTDYHPLWNSYKMPWQLEWL